MPNRMQDGPSAEVDINIVRMEFAEAIMALEAMNPPPREEELERLKSKFDALLQEAAQA